MSDKFAGGIKAGSTSVSVPVILRKTADNTENTGTVAAGVNAYYWRQGGTPTALTAATDLASITSAYAAGGWKAADATDAPGVYRLDVDNAAFATGADWVVISVKVASCYLFVEKYHLTTNNVQSGDCYPSVNTGGAAPGAANGFLINGSNAGPLTINNGVTFTNPTGAGFVCSATGGGANANCGIVVQGSSGQHDIKLSGVGDIFDAINNSRLVELGDLAAPPTNWSSLLITSGGRVAVQSGVTINTAINNFQFPMVLKTDHISPATGKTITAQRCIDGGSYASCSNAPTEVANGTYRINLSASDMNGGIIKLLFTEASCDPCEITFVTTP